jgi:thioredoxin reductase
MSAALVLGRARRKTLLLDEGEQSNRSAPHVGGLLGLDGTPPGELYDRARAQLAEYDSVKVRDTAATGAGKHGDSFTVELEGEVVSSRTVIIATGMDYEVPDVPGFRELWGASVFHCPFCHGWEVRDKCVVVFGSGEDTERQAEMLAAWTDDLTLVDPDEVSHLKIEDGELKAVVGHDGSERPCDAVAIHTPLKQRGRLAEQLELEMTEEGHIEVDATMETSVPGIYAAGDVAIAPQQVAIAMGSGHLAGIKVVRQLLLGHD